MSLNNIKQEAVRALVVLPTYNEAASLIQVVEALLNLPVHVDILVVDDSSPDGTANLAKNHPQFEKRLFLLLRPKKQGLATAYKEGFQWSLKRGYDVCMEMDSDLSHDPEDIPRLLKTIEQGADLAIGSRYLNGISVINWPLRRLIVSICAGIYTRMISGLPLTDPTGGFKAIHRRVIEALNWDEIKSDGYGFQIEVSFYAHKQGFRLEEIPIIFTERRDGESKFSFAIALEAAIRVLQLGLFERFKSAKNLAPFASGKKMKRSEIGGAPYPETLGKKTTEIE
ncbi:MAG: glycosyl hydrolase [Nitrospinaceae bacterium]|nr:MAG: glycosyl hydrolase [Nitrospinaceae bacterium]